MVLRQDGNGQFFEPRVPTHLADPNDRRRLDVLGFDTSAPAVISDFVRAA